MTGGESKVMTAKEAVERFINPGTHICFGGFTLLRRPMAIARELVRQDIGDLFVTMNGSAPLEEMLAGAGLIKWIETSYIGYDGVMPVPYALRKSIEEGVVELIEDYSNWSFAQRTLAGRLGLPFMPCMSDMGSDLMTYDTFGKAGLRGCKENGEPIHPGIAPHKYAVIDDPFDGFGLRPSIFRTGADTCACKTNRYATQKEYSTRYTGKPGVKVALVPPLKPEVCVIHAQRAAQDGTVRIEGVVGPDMDQALCGRILIVECERICPPEELRLTPECNQIPPHFVHAVVEQPFGAYPMFVPNYYDCDGRWLPNYSKAVAGRDLDGVKAFWREHVGETKDDWDYLLRRVGWKRLRELRADPKYHYNPNLIN